MRPASRLPALLVAAIAAAMPGVPGRGADADVSRVLWTRHCGGCHADGMAEGGLALDALLAKVDGPPPATGSPEHAAWMAVLRNLRAETMPPAAEPAPSAAARRQLIDFVEREIFRLDPQRPDPGRGVLRRLNRREYAHTIHDLTGLDLDLERELPDDDTGYGFDTVGAVLSMSPLLVDKYLALANRVADAVLERALEGLAPGAVPRGYPAAVQRVFALGPPPADPADEAGHLRATVGRLADRAFRGAGDDATTDRLVVLARAARDGPGGGFERGVTAALAAMLASPRFLFRFETAGRADAVAPAVPLEDIPLASRLSYFLWSSMPDDDLLAIARSGRLHAELAAQVTRMIADPRSDRFVADFVGQWLQTRDVETRPVDAGRVLEGRDRVFGRRVFSGRVRRAMRQETELLVAHVLRSNKPATDLLIGDETFLNGPLARFYGIPDVEGPEMRLVALPADAHRGGLLTHGSVLVVTSNPTRTSPVKRGKFILDTLLGTPAPPAPPNVPPLEAAAGAAAGAATMRELMERHRHEPLCASCHARMDPLGLALEAYNAIGQWRGDAASDLDTSGQLMTGERFSDAAELAAVIAGPRRRDFHRCLAEKLLVYALGRGLDSCDGPAVDTILERMDRDGGGLATLVGAVCESVPFRMRRAMVSATEEQP